MEVGWVQAWMISFLLAAAQGAPAAAPPPARASVPAAALSPGEHQAVVNGVRLWYRVAGRPDGAPVLFLHGGPGQGSQSFAALAGPALEGRLRIIYLDQRGSGRSERPWTKAYSMDHLVEDVEALRRAWKLPKIALIGHSFGTALAMEYAAKYPNNVSHVVLAAAIPDLPAALDDGCARLATVNPAAHQRAVAALPAGSKEKCNIFKAFQKGSDFQAFVNANMYPDPATGKLVDRWDEEGGLRNTGELSGALFNAGLTKYRFEQAARLTMPVLVIAGDKDFQASLGPQRALVERLPKGRLLEYRGHGHFMMVEDPQRFARDVAAFLGR